MTEKDLKDGARSAIQKAIRRGNLNLANTAFDLIVSDKMHWNWFKWRLPILVEEEAWYMLGELGDFLKKAPTPKDYKKFIFQLCLVNKSKDSAGLYRIAEFIDQPKHPEVQFMSSCLKKANDNPTSIIDEVYDACVKHKKLSVYENEAMLLMLNRAQQGGMLVDRFCCISSLILISYRGLNKKEIKKHIKYAFERYKKRGGKKPKKIDFPWYIFDMHTYKGKVAQSLFIKKHLSKFPEIKNFTQFWFYHGSGSIPSYLINEIGIKLNPTALDTMYYHYVKKIHLEGTGNLWKKVQPIIKELIEWSLSK